MSKYSVQVAGAYPSGGGQEYVYVELVPAANTEIAIDKIVITTAGSTTSDVNDRIKVYRETTAGTGGVSYTPILMDPSSPAATTTCNIKTGNTDFTKGTTTDVLLDTTIQSRGNFEWIARDKDEYLRSNPGERIIITANQGGTSQYVQTYCTFIE